MKLLRRLCRRWWAPIAVVAVLAAGSPPAAALSVDQVLRLRRAGVSDRLIRSMISHELAVARQGGVGRYLVRQAGGREIIVYYAASAGGVSQTPLPLTGTLAASPQVRRTLGAQTSAAAATKGVYSLHLASYRSQDQARQHVARLEQKGVSAWVQAVDLKEKGRWYRVLVGRFAQRAAAEQQGRKLRQAGSIGEFTVIGR